MWHFSKGDLDGRNLRDPAELSVHSHGELSQLQIMVREVLQNSVDNRVNKDKVRVHFRFLYLGSRSKDQFLTASHFEEMATHLVAVRDEQIKSKGQSFLPDPKDVMSKGYILKILAIEDYGSIGLIGPEHEKESGFFKDTPHCFMGLCRNVGDSQKVLTVSGGTHGIGKTVLWKNSRLKLVFFYSQLAIPYVEPATSKSYSYRFFGQCRLPGHYVNDEPYRGEGYFGKREADLTRCFYDDEANDYASRLEIPLRKGEDMSGTSILVVDFDDPDVSEADENKDLTVARIKEAAEIYFWPAIVDSKLEVQITTHKAEVQLAQPELRPEILPFIKAYKGAITGSPDSRLKLDYCDVDLPSGPHNEKRGKARLAVSTFSEQADATSNTNHVLTNRAALIRGAGMVVGYWRVPRRGLGGKDFRSVVIGGTACPNCPTGFDQTRLEQLLAWAEPVTHDTWTPNAEMLRSWYGAQSAVKRIRDEINKAISDATTAEEKPEGKAAPLLSRMFPFETGDKTESPPRDIRIDIAKEPYRMSPDGKETDVYGFEIRVIVPAMRDFKKEYKPDKWRIGCRYGFYGEARRRKIIEHARSRFNQIRINGGDWQELDTDFQTEATYESSVSDQKMVYELRGVTESLDRTMARTTKHDLEITVFRGYEEEEK